MFAPSRDQVRRFFFDTWRKYTEGAPLAGIETIAIEVILLHPEYHGLLNAPERAAVGEFTPEEGKMNPFLHLSLHMAIEEQVAIDQPSGLRKEVDRLTAMQSDRHEALHQVLDCLGETIWRAQRDGKPLDGEAYLDCVRRQPRAHRD